MKRLLPTLMILTMALPASAQSTPQTETKWHQEGIRWEFEWGQEAEIGLTPDLLSTYLKRTGWEPWRPPVRVAASPPTNRVYGPGIEQWRTLIETHFAPEDAAWAMRVMDCESKGDPYVDNPYSSASGLFQFLDSTWAFTPYANQSVYDPVANVAAAAWLFYTEGPHHWVCK